MLRKRKEESARNSKSEESRGPSRRSIEKAARRGVNRGLVHRGTALESSRSRNSTSPGDSRPLSVEGKAVGRNNAVGDQPFICSLGRHYRRITCTFF